MAALIGLPPAAGLARVGGGNAQRGVCRSPGKGDAGSNSRRMEVVRGGDLEMHFEG